MDSGIIIIKNQNQNITYFPKQGNPQEARKSTLQHRKHVYTPLVLPSKKNQLQAKK